MAETELQKLQATQDALGPRSIKTKDFEAEAHNLKTVYELHNKLSNPVPATFCGLNKCIAKPVCE